MTLNDEQLSLLSTSLQVAREKFLDNARTIRSIGGKDETLARQFETQANGVLELKKLFDDAVGVELYEEYKE